MDDKKEERLEFEVYVVYVPNRGFTRIGSTHGFTEEFSDARVFAKKGHAELSRNFQRNKDCGAVVVPAKVSIKKMDMFKLKLKS